METILQLPEKAELNLMLEELKNRVNMIKSHRTSQMHKALIISAAIVLSLFLCQATWLKNVDRLF